MEKTDPLDRLVEELRTYLRNRPALTDTLGSVFKTYETDIDEIMKKWARAATSRQKRSKRWEQVTRLKGNWGLRFFWKSGEVDWEHFEKQVNNARKVTDKEIEKRLAHNDKIKADAQKRDSDSRQKRKKKKDGMLYFGVSTDRAFNMLVKNESSGIEIFGDFSYRVKWVHDVFSEKLWQYILKEKLLELKKEERQLLPTEAYAGLTEELFSSFKQHLPVIRFTDKEFKETTGLKHLRNHEIAELVKKYIRLTIEGEGKTLLDPDTGKYKSITVIGSIADGFINKTGNYSKRFHKPEHVYIFSLNFWGLVLFQNLLNKSYTKFTKGYYKLSGRGQELYRNIAQYKQSFFLPERIGKILGYSKNERPARIIEQGIKYFRELKDAGLIDWKPETSKEGKTGIRVWCPAPHQLSTESQTKNS